MVVESLVFCVNWKKRTKTLVQRPVAALGWGRPRGMKVVPSLPKLSNTTYLVHFLLCKSPSKCNLRDLSCFVEQRQVAQRENSIASLI